MGGLRKVLASAPVAQGETEVITERHVGTELGELPEACIATILAFTSSLDVARLACASQTFRDASKSDAVWQKMLPARYEEIIAQVPSWRPKNTSMREIYDFLYSGCFVENDTQENWSDKASGGVCRSVGARSLHIAWKEHPWCWTWISREGSKYPEVAHLKEVRWMEAQGRLQCHLPPGEYVVSWRLYMAFVEHNCLSLRLSFIEWGFKPVKFTLEANGQLGNTERYLTADGKAWDRVYATGQRYAKTPSRLGYIDAWNDIDVGVFTVKESDSVVELSFSMTESEGGKRKSQLSVDCVLIHPASVKQAGGRRTSTATAGRGATDTLTAAAARAPC